MKKQIKHITLIDSFYSDLSLLVFFHLFPRETEEHHLFNLYVTSSFLSAVQCFNKQGPLTAWLAMSLQIC